MHPDSIALDALQGAVRRVALDLFRRFAKTIPGGVENVTLAEEFFDEGDTWEACLQ